MVDRITRHSSATLPSPASSRQGPDFPTLVSSASSAPASEPTRIAAGELTQYLEARVDSAVDHLDGRLHADDLQFVKDELLQELTTNPVLIELTRRATGMVPGSVG
jgi:hypothetical protein